MCVHDRSIFVQPAPSLLSVQDWFVRIYQRISKLPGVPLLMIRVGPQVSTHPCQGGTQLPNHRMGV